jgi:hypothetical protein
LFSDKYFARNIPPSDHPTKITPSLKYGKYLENHKAHSSYLALYLEGMLGINTSYSSPKVSGKFFVHLIELSSPGKVSGSLLKDAK